KPMAAAANRSVRASKSLRTLEWRIRSSSIVLEALGHDPAWRNSHANQARFDAVHHRPGSAYEIQGVGRRRRQASAKHLRSEFANPAGPACRWLRQNEVHPQVDPVGQRVDLVAIEDLRLGPVAIDQVHRMGMPLF